MNSTLGNRHGSAVITTPSDTEILMTRQFDAPAALVFKALTTPELVQRWWGFETSMTLLCTVRNQRSATRSLRPEWRAGSRWLNRLEDLVRQAA